MRIGALVCRGVWGTALLGSLLVGCGEEPGVTREDSESSESAESEVVLESFVPETDAEERPVHAANMSCTGGVGTWSQYRSSAWNANPNTVGTYYCSGNVPSATHGWTVSVQTFNAERTGSIQLRCYNGTWQTVGGSCDGKVVNASIITGANLVCSSSDPVRSKWIGWYVADLKRCAEYDGLEWWVTQYNNNAACHASNNYDGYGSKDACWRKHFQLGGGDSYTEAQSTGHIAALDEYNACGSLGAYPWTNVFADGAKCKYRP